MSVPVISNHSAAALARLAAQFRNKRNFTKLIEAICAQVQELETAFQELFGAASIDDADGDALDGIGKIVGEKRAGSATAQYRLRIRARIRSNLSSGTVEEIYSVFRALLGSTVGYVFTFTNAFPAGFRFRISGITIDALSLPIFVRFLGASKGAAIQAWFEWQPAADADTFTTATAVFLSSAVLAGATSLPVYGTAEIPDAGTLLVDVGLPQQETLVYTSKTPTAVSGFLTTQSHPQNAALTLQGTVGKGWGDENNAATGGRMSGAAVAVPI